MEGTRGAVSRPAPSPTPEGVWAADAGNAAARPRGWRGRAGTGNDGSCGVAQPSPPSDSDSSESDAPGKRNSGPVPRPPFKPVGSVLGAGWAEASDSPPPPPAPAPAPAPW